MPNWLKIVLLIFVIAFVMIAGGIFLGVRWITSHRGQLREQHEKIIVEAKEFGAARDSNACVAESLNRGDACGFAGVVCEVKVRVFLDQCLRVARVPPDFCGGVPKPENLVGSVRWGLEECTRRGHPNEQRCTRLLQSVQHFCDAR